MIHSWMTPATGLLPTVIALAMALLAHPVSADPPTFVFTKIADKDTPIPGGTGTFTYIDSTSHTEKMIPTIDGKTVAFVGFGSFSQSGIYAGGGPGDGSPLSMVVNRDTPIPDGSGAFKDFYAVSIAGQHLAFRGTGAAVGQIGIYRKSGDTLTRIADVQTEVPDQMGDLFGGFIDPSVDRDGAVAFRGGFKYLRGLGVYKSVGNSLETVADIETPVPGIPNTLFDSRLTGTQTDYLSIANGVVVFFMESWYGAEPWAGLYKHQAGSISKAVDYNTQPPGASSTFSPLGMPATDALGNIVFRGNPGSESGIYLHREGDLIRIADLQTGIPGSTDTFASFGLQVQTPSVDGDLIAFTGAATTNFADVGIYADIAGELVKVIAPGDRLDGKLVTRLYLGDEAVSDRSIAFLVGIEGGLHAIYRADLLLDPDEDGHFDPSDNCPNDYNPDQENSDGDGRGDACDIDDDNDGVSDVQEAAMGTSPTDPDSDNDGVSDLIDSAPSDPDVVPPTAVIDVTGSGSADALTDGVLVLRYLFGFSGENMVEGALDPAATHTDPNLISGYLSGNAAWLDIDKNGRTDALTDGILILRYLFGLRGDTLTEGAVAPDAERTVARDIEEHITALLP